MSDLSHLKYCEPCRTQYGCHCTLKPCRCHECGDWPEDEAKAIERGQRVLAELRANNRSFFEHTKAFWERIRAITKGNEHANHR